MNPPRSPTSRYVTYCFHVSSLGAVLPPYASAATTDVEEEDDIFAIWVEACRQPSNAS